MKKPLSTPISVSCRRITVKLSASASPPLTEERRKQLAKQCKAEGETAKVSIRNARRDGIDALKKAVKDGLAEDEQKNAEAKLQKVHDKYIAKIEEMLAEKDKEIMTV